MVFFLTYSELIKKVIGISLSFVNFSEFNEDLSTRKLTLIENVFIRSIQQNRGLKSSVLQLHLPFIATPDAMLKYFI